LDGRSRQAACQHFVRPEGTPRSGGPGGNPVHDCSSSSQKEAAIGGRICEARRERDSKSLNRWQADSGLRPSPCGRQSASRIPSYPPFTSFRSDGGHRRRQSGGLPEAIRAVPAIRAAGGDAAQRWPRRESRPRSFQPRPRTEGPHRDPRHPGPEGPPLF
jgi:hypothetical protein